MKREDYVIGQDFWMGGRRWRCTDIGTRVVTAICLEEPKQVLRSDRQGHQELVNITDEQRKSWHRGPPYAVEEDVIDEYDMEGCAPTEQAWKELFE